MNHMRDDDWVCYCSACGVDIYADGAHKPALDNDGAWAKLAEHHADDCDWILTRGWARPELAETK